MKKKLQTPFSSRQYMMSSDFEVYYYNDYHLPSVNIHSHDYYEYYFFMSGNVVMTINKEKYSIKPGDFVLIPPGIEHHPSFIKPDDSYKRFVLWVSREYYEGLFKESVSYSYLKEQVEETNRYIFHNDVITFNAIQSMLFRLIEETKDERFGKDTELKLQVNSLILYLNRLIYEKNTGNRSFAEKKLYSSICDYVADHLEEDLSLDRIAGEFYVSKFHISHIFKDNIGISLHQYIMKKRLDACRGAIVGNEPISKICEQYGIHDYSSFYRAFKKEYGISPKEYKERYR